MVSSDPCSWVFTPFKKILNIYVLGCARSWLQLSGCSIFLATCRIFSCSMSALTCVMWDPVPSCCCSVSKLCLTLPDPVDCSTPGFPVSLSISQSLPKFMSIELVMPFNQWCQFLDPRSNPGPQPWKHRVLATGPPGKSLGIYIFVCSPPYERGLPCETNSTP